MAKNIYQLQQFMGDIDHRTHIVTPVRMSS